MPFGLDITIPVDADDPTLPYADDDDALLVPGSLLLLDPAHSSAPMGPLPLQAAFGTAPLANVAWKHLSRLLGAGDAASLGWNFVFDSSPDASAIRFEKTPRGGIHGIISRVNNGANFQGANVRAAGGGLSNFIVANPSHRYYFSKWSRPTRKGDDVTGAMKAAIFPTNGTVGGNYLFKSTTTGTLPAGGATSLGISSRPGPNNLANTFESIGVQGFIGVAPTGLNLMPSNWGTTSPDSFNLRWNIHQSYILYRAYMEDLTVSGRSYAEVEAIDYGLFQAAFAAGGRFSGDTFTDPAVLP